MTTATLVKVVRDPRSGEVHLPSEQVAVLRVTRNLDRTLLKVRWQSGGHCVVFPDDIEEISQNSSCDAVRRAGAEGAVAYRGRAATKSLI